MAVSHSLQVVLECGTVPHVVWREGSRSTGVVGIVTLYTVVTQVDTPTGEGQTELVRGITMCGYREVIMGADYRDLLIKVIQSVGLCTEPHIAVLRKREGELPYRYVQV